MIQTITKSDFRDAFRNMGRQDQFSYHGLGALYDYLEQYEEDTGEPVELDVIALCCEFAEYDSALDCIDDAGYEFAPDQDDSDDDKEAAALEYLRERTQVIEFDGGIIIQRF